MFFSCHTRWNACLHVCVHHSFLLSCPLSTPSSHSCAGEWIDFCECLFFYMSDFNYTTFENNVIGAVTQMAFGSPNSLLVCDRVSLCYIVLDVFYCLIYLVYTFWKFACLPSGTDICISSYNLIICIEPGTICLLYLVQINWHAKLVKNMWMLWLCLCWI